MNKKNREVNGNAVFSKRMIFVILTLLAASLTIYLLWSSSWKNKNGEAANKVINGTQTTPAKMSSGKILAHSYCELCHMFPDPSLLNKDKWMKVFPQMGLRMGIRSHGGEDYSKSVIGPDLVIPDRPLLDDGRWQEIIDYYLAMAPTTLPGQDRSIQIKRELPFFSFGTPAASFNGNQVLATYVKIDTTVSPARIFVANGRSNKLFLLNKELKVIDSINTMGPVVDMSFDKNEALICIIGKELRANSDKFGAVYQLHIANSGKMNLMPKPLFAKLGRPVQVLPVDLNGDHRTDYLICEFGSLTGALCWMENKGNGIFIRHVISDLPGAIKAYVDFPTNKSLPDLWVLFAQGEEGIYHFINEGNGSFETKRVLRFPPIYGSVFFERVDMDHDGYKDIVYACGDNGNATAVLKPYHGVYVFINDKHGNYDQKYFYPINGCYKAFARDFDGDGNIDIATISLFTDSRQPEEGFVYLKNTGGLNFTPFSLPLDTKFERAVTMDVGDINGDGMPDLLIGNAFFDFGPFAYNRTEPLFFTLMNRAH